MCAGFVIDALASDGANGLRLTDAAVAARRLADAYAGRLERLIQDAAWARHLHKAGRAEDFAACLTLSSLDQVPRLSNGAIVPGPADPVTADARR